MGHFLTTSLSTWRLMAVLFMVSTHEYCTLPLVLSNPFLLIKCLIPRLFQLLPVKICLFKRRFNWGKTFQSFLLQQNIFLVSDKWQCFCFCKLRVQAKINLHLALCHLMLSTGPLRVPSQSILWPIVRKTGWMLCFCFLTFGQKCHDYSLA